MQEYQYAIDVLNNFMFCWHRSTKKTFSYNYSNHSNIINITFSCGEQTLHAIAKETNPHVNVSLFFEKNLKKPPRVFEIYVDGFSDKFKVVEINQEFYILPNIDYVEIDNKIVNIYYFDDFKIELDRFLSTIGLNKRGNRYNQTILMLKNEKAKEKFLEYLMSHYQEFLKLKKQYLDKINKYCFVTVFVNVTGCELDEKICNEIFAENLALVELYDQYEISLFL